MTKEEILSRIERADKAYYEEDRSIMSDSDYDRLVRFFEQEYGPLAYVPGYNSKQFRPYYHHYQLLSLNKLFDDDPMAAVKLKNLIAKFGDVCIQPKIDGLTVAAYYDHKKDNGSAVFVTRGHNGAIGEILPAFIPAYEKPDIMTSDIIVRGEAFLTREAFLKVQELQRKKKEEPFQNIRNAAAGILRNKERSPYLQYLSYIVYEIPGSTLSTEQQLKRLADTKFTVVPVYQIGNLVSLLDIRNIWNDINTKDIPVDGLVIKPFTMTNTREIFGQTRHHPNDAIAWKRSADTYETQVVNVTWQVGRDKVTPVAELAPVEIDSTIVSRATLHNLGFFKKLKLHKGDTVSICKSGEVIPKILDVINHTDGTELTAPITCPCCNSPLETFSHDNVADIRCVNPKCIDRIVQNICFITSKEVFDIKGLSESTARKIVEKFGVEEEELAVFSLNLADIKQLPGFGPKSAQNLYDALVTALNKPWSIPILIKACCVTGIGSSVGDILTRRFKDVPTIKKALGDINMLRRIEGIGEKTATVLSSRTFRDKFDIITSMFAHEQKPAEKQTGVLEGTVWAITGKFNQPRSKLVELIKEQGGEVSNGITKKTNYLLTADANSTSSKAVKARELGVKTVSFEDFLLGKF